MGPIFEMLIKQPESSEEKDHERIIAIAYASKEVWEMAEKRFNIYITGGYGSTEAGIPVTSPYSDVINKKTNQVVVVCLPHHSMLRFRIQTDFQ